MFFIPGPVVGVRGASLPKGPVTLCGKGRHMPNHPVEMIVAPALIDADSNRRTEEVMTNSAGRVLMQRSLREASAPHRPLSKRDAEQVPRGETGIWSNTDFQYQCLLDFKRTTAFQAAIQTIVKQGDIVVDAGAGSGILSFFASASRREESLRCRS